MTREELESRDNWHATFECTCSESREPLDCLMRNIISGYYWHTPSHTGMFSAGATRNYDENFLVDALRRDILELVAGRMPRSLFLEYFSTNP